MARSLWIGALVGMLACIAPGRVQVMPYEHIVTVREPGRPAQRCRVLKVWTDKDGSKGCQVQEVNTREIITVMDVGSSLTSGGTKRLCRASTTGARRRRRPRASRSLRSAPR